jgi:hypothetical protein
LVLVPNSIVLVESNGPSRSFHATGRTKCDALVSTNASHLTLMESSMTFPIFTEVTIPILHYRLDRIVYTLGAKHKRRRRAMQ